MHGNGEGVLFLGSYVEGSTEDTNSTVGTGTMAGTNQFSFTFVVPSSITPGMSVTAISGGTAGAPVVSQFAADSQTIAGSVGPTISSGGNATVLVGQTFSYQGFFGDNASTTLSGTVNYDDGTGNQALSIQATAVTPASYDEYTPLATGTYNLSHIFTAPGTYDVTFSILDGDSYTASGGVTVTVLAAPPTIDPGQVTLAPTNDLTDTASPTIVSVDESITISGTFTDPNPGVTSAGEIDTVTIYWGDGSTPTPATVDQATHTFTATHVYTAPSSVEAGKGLYAVTATLTDSEGLSTTIGGGKLYAEVDDVPPTGLALGFTSETVAPGGAVSLSGQFQAPQDANDLYDVVVNWGDGTTPTEISLLGGVTSFSGLTHHYQSQPAYRAGTPYTVTVSVNDAFEPLDLATATASVSVVAPTASALAVNLSTNEITEGGTATLSGTLTAAVPGDPHVVVIDWGDGTSTDVPLAAGVATFSGRHPSLPAQLGEPGRRRLCHHGDRHRHRRGRTAGGQRERVDQGRRHRPDRFRSGRHDRPRPVGHDVAVHDHRGLDGLPHRPLHQPRRCPRQRHHHDQLGRRHDRPGHRPARDLDLPRQAYLRRLAGRDDQLGQDDHRDRERR